VVLVHGETVSEPVIPGTNRAAIEAGCDILAHPGMITAREAALAARRGVYLELTTRKNHARPNRRVLKLARSAGANVILNTDAHGGDDLVTEPEARRCLKRLGMSGAEIVRTLRNAGILLKRLNIKRG
jgi:histidinol phosphatase-like PHP family hydrolase